MEENNQQPKKRAWKFDVIYYTIIVILIAVSYYMFKGSKENKRHAETIQQLYLKEIKSKANIELKYDSIKAINKTLSEYLPLTSAMIVRDKARENLKYKPGDFARMKVDSSKILIKDIIAGGDVYNYTLEYEIQKPDRSTERVSPKLLY